MFELATLSAVPTWIPLPRQLRFRRARRELQRIVDQLVAERGRRPGEAGDDVLSRLIVSTRAGADPRVGRQRLRDELVTLLLAGHETTASTLGWTLYLHRPPPRGAASGCTQEAVEVLGDRPPATRTCTGCTYTAMVVEEVMRLYPPVWMLPRKAQADDEIGGYQVPAGADVLICPYTLHRHPRFWDGPGPVRPGAVRPGPARRTGRGTPTSRSARARGSASATTWGMMEATFVLAMLRRELRLAQAARATGGRRADAVAAGPRRPADDGPRAWKPESRGPRAPAFGLRGPHAAPRPAHGAPRPARASCAARPE